MALIIIKLGGELLLGDPPPAKALGADIKTLVERGEQIAIVHGGGTQATTLQKRLGLNPHVVAGRRITDADTLDVMKMTIAGEVNVNLCALLVAAGTRPVGLHGASGPAIRAHRRPPRVVTGGPPEALDLGLVGDVEGFDLQLLRQLMLARYTPVVACLGCDPTNGQIFNINADVVASKLASEIRADLLVLTTNVDGVLTDINDPSTRIPTLTRTQATDAIARGAIRGGMIPKVQEAFEVVGSGVKRILIAGNLGAGELCRAIDIPGSVGTTLS